MSQRKFRLAFLALLILQLIVPAPIMAAAIGQFTSVLGDVTQTTAGVVVRPQAKSPIQVMDMIVTGDRATAAMVLGDESVLTLAENSRFEVREFHVRNNVRKGFFNLTLGKLTADVKSFIGGGSSFEVRTPTAVAGVRGTGFEIAVAMVAGQMTTTVTCTVGALSVSALSVTGAVISTVTVVAGQTAVITASGIAVSAAAAAGAAGAAGATAGTAAAAGIGVGTVAAGVAAAAAAAAIAVGASGGGGSSTTSHH